MLQKLGSKTMEKIKFTIIIPLLMLIFIACSEEKPQEDVEEELPEQIEREKMSVITYNIRVINKNDGKNNWPYRKDNLVSQLKYYAPDVFGIQEALVEQVEYLEENLPNYVYVGVGRKDGKTQGEFNAIFYNVNKFELLEEDTFWLSETPNRVSVGWDAALYRICTYALFKNENSKEKFWVFNTHFDHKGDLARKESAKLIIEKIQSINTKKFPVILMGDLNLEPEAESIEYLATEMDDSRVISKVVSGPEGTLNLFNFGASFTKRIDYIFTSKGNVEVLEYAVLDDSKNQRYFSDHFPIYIEFKLK